MTPNNALTIAVASLVLAVLGAALWVFQARRSGSRGHRTLPGKAKLQLRPRDP
jgi:hypothetical protein